MDWFLARLISLIFCAIWVFCGAHAIRNAIRYFKSARYFLCGLDVMCAVICSAGIFDLFLTS